ncbi:hypothetical protein IQ13_4187 [Lacibacter cauensis]|uniref:Apea-like HEPN domain-containing protein n=1 Tax=Lacibacter cauensis TaxID=510947 RepID=A0A562S969_9BACT|nr:hypothetical protein [Lacibacter cauensis]TWI77945.1 hypothetical protein IQ13_4187 [Lacibacter cauensis]
MLKNLQSRIGTLLGYLAAKGLNELSFDDPPNQPMLNAAQNYYDDVWSFDLFNDYFERGLKEQIRNRKDDIYISNLIGDISTYLQLNIETVIIVVPLKGAYIKKSVTIENISIIKTITDGNAVTPPTLPISDFIKEVSQLTAIPDIRIRKAVAQITDHRAPGFLSCPLLIIQTKGQFIELTSQFLYLIKNYNIFLRLLAAFNQEKVNRHTIWLKAEHFFAIGSWANYQHAPLMNSINVPFDLSFLLKPSNQLILKQIISIFESKSLDNLQSTYFRALRFFNFSIDGQSPPFNEISFKILNILIAEETLMMFSTRDEKKKKLANIMVVLSNIPVADRQKYLNAAIEVYNDRSGLVHSGKQQLSKYKLDQETQKLESKSFEHLNEMMLAILTHFPQWYAEIQVTASPIQYLEEWKKKVASYIPEEKYSAWQKLAIRVIYFLKKNAKIHSEV